MTYEKRGEGFHSQINLGNAVLLLVFFTEGCLITYSASVLYESSRQSCSISQVLCFCEELCPGTSVSQESTLEKLWYENIRTL